jgi:hypothetical protein
MSLPLNLPNEGLCLNDSLVLTVIRGLLDACLLVMFAQTFDRALYAAICPVRMDEQTWTG